MCLVWREEVREPCSSLPHRVLATTSCLPGHRFHLLSLSWAEETAGLPVVKEKFQNNSGESLRPPVVNTPGISVGGKWHWVCSLALLERYHYVCGTEVIGWALSFMVHPDGV